MPASLDEGPSPVVALRVLHCRNTAVSDALAGVATTMVSVRQTHAGDGRGPHMADFDPEKFEAKYKHYFAELQRAYKDAFEFMNDRYDSDLIHAIDQQVLSESEPFYEGDGEFRVELPEDPYERVEGVLVEEERFRETLDTYVDRIETELRSVFGFEGD